MKNSKAPIVKLDDLTLQYQSHGSYFASGIAAIAAPLGATHLGARLVEVPTGKIAWPFHNHHANDEMFVVLSGVGDLRLGKEFFPLAQNTVVVCPAGGPEMAHQIINRGSEPLRYLAISSMREPDVMEYPDSGKISVFAGAAPGGNKVMRRVSSTFRLEDEVDYWDGESE